jgi:hypothetical protein
MPTTLRSRTVRRILRLEAEADRQATREARATARALTLRRRGDTLRTEARALEASLNGGQRAELTRARVCLASPTVAPLVPRPRRQLPDGPPCPVIHGEAAADGGADAPPPQEV